jgi:hypothetical protein
MLDLLEDRCVPTDGVLDPTFGTTGVVTTQVAPNLNEYAGVAIYAPGTANAGRKTKGKTKGTRTDKENKGDADR